MDVQLLRANAIDPVEWDTFVGASPQGNIYHLHTYLDNLLADWQAIVVRDGDGLLAAFPFASRRKWGLHYVLQPYFAQYLGILLRNKYDSVYKNLEAHKKAIQLIHNSLPREIRYIDLYFAPEFQYDLPLLWLGWTLRPRYTYWVDIAQGYEAFLQGAASHVRREIKKAEQAGLRVETADNPEAVVEILKKAKPEAVRSIEPRYFTALCRNAHHYFAAGKSVCLLGYDGDRAIAGIIYFFHGEKMIYYQGSTLPEYKNSGIMSYIIAESVRRFGAAYRYLDFDGSMIEPIERFFRGFGAYPVRYWNFRYKKLFQWP